MSRQDQVLPQQQTTIQKSSPRRFSVLESTAELHKSTDDTTFYGPYAHIRKTLDYSYHNHYRKQRQWLQDSILDDLLYNVMHSRVCTTPVEPWLIYTVGAPGAGKRHTLLKLIREGRLPLLSFVHVDADEIRRRLPEFSLYVRHAPNKVNELTRRESGYIMEILTQASLQAGKNVVLDGSLQDAAWYEEFDARLREKYPELKIAVIHVTAPFETILQRASVSFPNVAELFNMMFLICSFSFSDIIRDERQSPSQGINPKGHSSQSIFCCTAQRERGFRLHLVKHGNG